MSDISIENTLSEPLTVYDSYQATDEHDNYYGSLNKVSDLAANSRISIPAPHPVSTLIVFDPHQKPLTRWTAGLSHTSFVASDRDVQAMAQADAFVTFVAENPTSPEATQIAGLKAAKDIDSFFQGQAAYALVTTSTYMLALTYRAANPAPVGTKPDDVTYSLSRLITSLTGLAYPPEMPDISISKFFFRDDGGILTFGGTVDLTNMPLDPTVSSVILAMLAAAGPVNVQVAFDTNIGLNVAGTKIVFSYQEIDVPLGGSDVLRIRTPTVSLTINPLFKFVVLEITADFPFTVLDQNLDTTLSMVVDNIEVEVGLSVAAHNATLGSPPILKGVHFDSFGLGMGVIFEPPGFALGVQGQFHIGDGNTDVALDDDQFAIIFDLEGDLPNPVYLSFYIPRLDLTTVLAALTDVTIDIGIPVEFADLSFTWSENPLEPLALPDGTMSKGGYGFSGYLHLFGLKCFADVEVALTGVTADAVMGPLDLAGILRLTGRGAAVLMKFDAQGNPIRNNTIPKTAAERAAIAAATTKEIVPAGGPELHLGTASAPYVTIDANATLFGVSFASVDIVVDNTGLDFDLAMPLARVSCHLSTAGNLGASFSYGPDFTVPLPDPLGTIHLQTTIGFSFSVAVTSTDVTFTASGGFAFMGVPLTFGPVTLDVDISGLDELVRACCDVIVRQATSVFGPVIGNSLVWATGVVDGAVSEVGNIATGLNDYFHHPVDDAARILHDAGLEASAAARQLKDAYTGVTATTLAGALGGPFGLTSVVAGTILKSCGYPAAEIGAALKSAFGLDATSTAQILSDLAFPTTAIATTISGIFALSPNDVGNVLKAVGIPAQAITDAFHSLGGAFSSVGDAISGAVTTVEHHLDPTSW